MSLLISFYIAFFETIQEEEMDVTVFIVNGVNSHPRVLDDNCKHKTVEKDGVDFQVCWILFIFFFILFIIILGSSRNGVSSSSFVARHCTKN